MTGAFAARLAEVTGGTVAAEHGVVTADVAPAQWLPAATALREDAALALDFFDLLTVVDQLPRGLDVVLRLWSVAQRHAVHLRTTLDRNAASLPTLTGVYAGAAWHERHAAEMFGIDFAGHPGLTPLLLPAGGVPTPLRKEHVLSRRSDRPWPGAEDPAYSGEGGRPPRRRLQPPGAPS